MLSKEVRKALQAELAELRGRLSTLDTERAGVELKIKNLDNVLETPGVGVSGPSNIQAPIIAILRANPHGITPAGINIELLKQGLTETPSRRLITSVWQVLYRLKNQGKIKVRSGNVHVWVAGAVSTRIKPGGLRDVLTQMFHEKLDEGLTITDIKTAIDERGVVYDGKTNLRDMLGIVLNKMKHEDQIKVREGRYVWTGGVVATNGGWSKLTPEQRSAEMARRRATAKQNVTANVVNFLEKVTSVIREQPGITRSALRGEMEAVFKPTGKTPTRDLLWIQVSKLKKLGRLREDGGRLWLQPVAALLPEPEAAPEVPDTDSEQSNGHGPSLAITMRDQLMRCQKAGLTRQELTARLEKLGVRATGKQNLAERVTGEAWRLKDQGRIKENAEGRLFLTAKAIKEMTAKSKFGIRSTAAAVNAKSFWAKLTPEQRTKIMLDRAQVRRDKAAASESGEAEQPQVQ